MLRPASPGTGVIAGGAMRLLLEAAGVKDVLAKIIGTTNPHNVLGATVDALKQLEDATMVQRRRGVQLPAEAGAAKGLKAAEEARA